MALDDAVVNLQRFIAYLTATTGALEKSVDHFKECGQRFSQLEDEADDEGRGVNGELEEMGSALDTGLRETEDALRELTQAATDGEDRTDGAQDKLKDASSGVEGEAEKTLAELAEAQARLVARGFEALGQRLDESVKELEAETQESEQAFAQFDASAAGLQIEGEAAWDQAEAELDEAIGELSQAESTLEAATGESVQGFDAAAGEFEQQCTDLTSDIDLVYDALDAAVVEQGQEWEQHAATLAKDAVTFVESGAQERLEQPTNLVQGEALSALEQEFTALGGVLDAGTDTAGVLQPLAEELARCQVVVAEVAELMNALAG